MTQISTLARKTKTEILGEYEKLLGTLETARNESREVHQPKHVEVMTSARKEFTSKKIEDAVGELKALTSGKLSDVSKKISDTLDELLQQTQKEVEKFSGLTEAIDLSEKRLKSEYNIEVVATTLETLITEYAEKKKQLELEHATQHTELMEAIAMKKRDWQREEEEHTYMQKTSRMREQTVFDENRKKKEEELRVRESVIQEAESELATLRSRVQNIPAEIEKTSQDKEKEVAERLAAEHKANVTLLEKTWESEKRIMELKFTHLEAQYKKLESEVTYAKKEIESAQKKAQELAVTVIEHGGGRAMVRNESREGAEKS